jgi:hypothetical protein
MIKILYLILCISFFACNIENSQQKTEYDELRKTLEEVMKNDQLYRINFYEYDKHYNTRLQAQLQLEIDKKNQDIVTRIIDKYCWLSIEEVGYSANRALLFVLLHSDGATQEKYLPVLRQAVPEKKARKQDLAMFIDIVEYNNNRPQIYGTQAIKKDGRYVLYNLIDPANVNKRRQNMELGTIQSALRKLIPKDSILFAKYYKDYF